MLSLLYTYTELLQEVSTPEKGIAFVLGYMYVIKISWVQTGPSRSHGILSSCTGVTPPTSFLTNVCLIVFN